MKTKPAEYTHW